MIKCDESMRRSKERCWTPNNRRWRCTGECKECHCALFKKDDGTWEHLKIRWGHPHGKEDNDGRS